MHNKAILSLFVSAILTVGCASHSEIEVIDLRYGLMTENKNGEWYVYKEGEIFPYKDNGICSVVGKNKPCMYFGHTFSYHLNSDVKELECIVEYDKPINSVDIDKDYGMTSVISWKEILQDRGKVASIGYSLKGNGMASTVTCKHKNQTVFSFKRTIEGYAP